MYYKNVRLLQRERRNNMAINFHPDYPNQRYIVFTEMAKGKPVNVYKGNNEKEAIRITNFWDERCDTYFYDLLRHGYDGYGTDANPPQYGTDPQKNLDLALNHINKTIERQAAAALARI